MKFMQKLKAAVEAWYDRHFTPKPLYTEHDLPSLACEKCGRLAAIIQREDPSDPFSRMLCVQCAIKEGVRR